CLSLTAIGSIPDGKTLRRNGAQAGDLLVVSGTIGDGALGLKVLRGELDFLDPKDLSFLADRYHLPQPRMALGTELRDLASSCIDISDGLMADIGHISDASSVAVSFDVDKVPFSRAATVALQNNTELLTILLTGGDDYELAFTIPPDYEDQLPELSSQTQTELTCIGRVEPGSGVRAFRNGTEMATSVTGWRHF
ncbi:MAG: AIR synthase-related protein, partial [Sneathiella sp.]|uniref:thiamine-phosphate kinase n=1 Tax=Sneathiella sp. TaxID=1964365 RepID=UPI0030024F6A